MIIPLHSTEAVSLALGVLADTTKSVSIGTAVVVLIVVGRFCRGVAILSTFCGDELRGRIRRLGHCLNDDLGVVLSLRFQRGGESEVIAEIEASRDELFGQWPKPEDLVDALARAFEDAAQPADPDERSRLQRIAGEL